MDTPRFSILIPARNEEKYLPACLDSIRVASEPLPDQVEIVVVLNRCTDRTEEIALEHGATIIREDAKNLAKTAVRHQPLRDQGGRGINAGPTSLHFGRPDLEGRTGLALLQ